MSLTWLFCLLIFPMIGYWHAWRWYMHRVVHSWEEAIGLLIFTAFLVFASVKKIVHKKAFNTVPLVPLILLAVAYSLSYMLSVPPMFRVAMALSALFFILYRLAFTDRPPISFWGLILVALPVVPSLQFYLGYPIRYISAFLTVPLLRLNGIAVFQDGTNLLWNDLVLQFDAPCSGVVTLWAGVFFSLFMSLVYRFDVIKTIGAIAFSFLLVLAGNVVRASSLFYLEVDAIPFEGEWLHEAIGSSTYVLVVGGIVFGLMRFQQWLQATPC